jgi:asparagine synthase (glutamine-hydrolysing)
MRHEALRRLAEDALQTMAERGVVRPDFVRQVWATHLPSHPHYFGTLVWILMMLEHWLRAHAPGYRFEP